MVRGNTMPSKRTHQDSNREANRVRDNAVNALGPIGQLLHQEHTDEHNDDLNTGAFPQVKKKPAKIHDARHNVYARIASTLTIIVLCALLGFGYVTQSQNSKKSYESLSEDELVRLLDETNRQVESLEQQRTQLSEQLDSIRSSANKQQELERVAQENERTSGILSGRLAAHGKGIEITITQGGKHIPASVLFTLIEELRNAGAEVMQFGDVRVVASTYFLDTGDGVVCDGISMKAPYKILVIGDPESLTNAVQIAGGVGSQLRVRYDAGVRIRQNNNVQIDATRQPSTYSYAKTVE